MDEARSRALAQARHLLGCQDMDPDVFATIEAALRAPQFTDEQLELLAHAVQIHHGRQASDKGRNAFAEIAQKLPRLPASRT